MQYQGIIFDLDGVLCSTDEYHYRAWKALAASPLTANATAFCAGSAAWTA